jgi:hypothetical protein
MSIEEIRQQKALALLECQEAEERATSLYRQVRYLSKTFDQIARMLDVGEDAIPSRIPSLDEMPNEVLKQTLDYESTARLLSDLFDAMKNLHLSQAKKRELGLR